VNKRKQYTVTKVLKNDLPFLEFESGPGAGLLAISSLALLGITLSVSFAETAPCFGTLGAASIAALIMAASTTRCSSMAVPLTSTFAFTSPGDTRTEWFAAKQRKDLENGPTEAAGSRRCFAEETDSVSALGAAVCWSMEAREEGGMFRVGRLVSFHSTPK